MAAQPRRTAEEAQRFREALVEHARRIVERDGPDALTMRALAAEAGCAVGLPYKVFASREELVTEVVRAEFRRLRAGLESLVAAAGTGTVGGGLATYAELLLGSPSMALVKELRHDGASQHGEGADGVENALMAALEGTLEAYLVAEKRAGRVDEAADERAFAFLIAGAVHNLLISGRTYPHPSLPELRRMFDAVAARLAPGVGATPPRVEGTEAAHL